MASLIESYASWMSIASPLLSMPYDGFLCRLSGFDLIHEDLVTTDEHISKQLNRTKILVFLGSQ